MKRQKLYRAHFVTDLYFGDDEYEMFYANDPDEVMNFLKESLGEHLIFCEIRKATWKERRYFRKYNICIAF